MESQELKPKLPTSAQALGDQNDVLSALKDLEEKRSNKETSEAKERNIEDRAISLAREVEKR